MSSIYTCRVEYRGVVKEHAPDEIITHEWLVEGKQAACIACARVVGWYQSRGEYVVYAAVTKCRKAGKELARRDHVDVLQTIKES